MQKLIEIAIIKINSLQQKQQNVEKEHEVKMDINPKNCDIYKFKKRH